jgi:transcriptional regulator with XRE-family HTH domain
MDLSLNISSPHEVAAKLAAKVRSRRLEVNLTQEGLAARAQVSLGTLKLYERSGRASIEFVIALAFALGAEREFEDLFPRKTKRSIEDVLPKSVRQRGRRK